MLLSDENLIQHFLPSPYLNGHLLWVYLSLHWKYENQALALTKDAGSFQGLWQTDTFLGHTCLLANTNKTASLSSSSANILISSSLASFTRSLSLLSTTKIRPRNKQTRININLRESLFLLKVGENWFWFTFVFATWVLFLLQNHLAFSREQQLLQCCARTQRQAHEKGPAVTQVTNSQFMGLQSFQRRLCFEVRAELWCCQKKNKLLNSLWVRGTRKTGFCNPSHPPLNLQWLKRRTRAAHKHTLL